MKTCHCLYPIVLLSLCSSAWARQIIEPDNCASREVEGRYSVQLVRVELRKALQMLADATCATFVVDTDAQATVTLQAGVEGKGPEWTADRLFNEVVAALVAQGLVVEDEGPRRYRVRTKPCLQPEELARAITAAGPLDRTIDGAAFDTLLANLNCIFDGARIVKVNKDGATAGFKFFAVRGRSAYDQLGIQNGDVLVAIDGVPLTDPGRATGIYARAKEAKVITYTVVRSEHELTLVLRIKRAAAAPSRPTHPRPSP